jgi:RNA polymerase sigma-70 factor (ECF subfamily)
VTQAADALPGDRRDPDDEADRQLFAAWAGGDKPAGQRLTVKYFEPIRAYFIRRAPEEYEELLQKTFLGLARAKDENKYRGEATVRIYIYCIARNVLRTHLRDLRRRPEFDPISVSLLEAYGRRPSSMLAEQQHHRILLDALQEIPSAEQDLLELRYWRGLTGPELRDMFEIPEGTVRSRLHTAIERLRTKFQDLSERPRDVSTEELERWLVELGSQTIS